MIPFELEKQNALTKDDKSDEQKLDERIAKLCEEINKLDNYFTTSSCAGRITLNRNSMNKVRDAFIYKTHNHGKLKTILEAVHSSKDDIIYFRQEPCALHVACKTLDDAVSLLQKAKDSGWKRSGIFSTNGQKFTCELVSTEWIVAPLKLGGHMLVSDPYIIALISEANLKLSRTWEKIERLKNLINNDEQVLS